MFSSILGIGFGVVIILGTILFVMNWDCDDGNQE